MFCKKNAQKTYPWDPQFAKKIAKKTKVYKKIAPIVTKWRIFTHAISIYDWFLPILDKKAGECPGEHGSTDLFKTLRVENALETRE